MSFPRVALFLMLLTLPCLASDSIDFSEPGTQTIAYSAAGFPIECTRLGTGPDLTLFLGAFHGDEPAGTALLQHFADDLAAHPEWLEGRSAILIPVVNPDGLSCGERSNAHGVDLNRNFPTRNWKSTAPGSRYWGGPRPASEPETRALIDLLERCPPDKIVSIHAPLGVVNFDGPAADLARAIAGVNGYPTSAYIGYPTPGSFGTYAGRERLIPTITLELADGEPWERGRDALLAALLFQANRQE